MKDRVLVTGASGFFGGHLLRRLGENTLSPARSQLDLLDAYSVRNYLKSQCPRAIVHAAGFVGGIGLNTQHPGRMAVDNLKMGLHILDAAARLGNTHVIIISTICVYPAGAPVPMSESSIYDGYPAQETGAYGLAKRELLSVAEALRSEFGLGFSYVIPTNLYGPGDHYDEEKSHVVPALIKKIYEAKQEGSPYIEVWGNGKATRDLLYVEDAAEAIVGILRTGPHPLPINLGSGREVSIRDLVEMLKNLIGYNGDIRWDVSRPVGAGRRLLDISRAQQCIGFNPSTSLKDGLCKSIDWYANHIRKVAE